MFNIPIWISPSLLGNTSPIVSRERTQDSTEAKMFLRPLSLICWLQVVLMACSSSSSTTSSTSSSSKVFSPGFLGGSTTERDEILQIGDPRLQISKTRKIPAEKIKRIQENYDIKEVRDRLHSALLNHQERFGFGRAIAAPQIGSDLSMIAMKLSSMEPAVTLYNPEIVYASPEQVTLWDDCFSIADYKVRVSRHKSITVKFIDDRGDRRVWECNDIALSELLQHEIDHLHGVLATDCALPPIRECNTIMCESVVRKEEWEKHKDNYNLFVDYVPHQDDKDLH